MPNGCPGAGVLAKTERVLTPHRQQDVTHGSPRSCPPSAGPWATSAGVTAPDRRGRSPEPLANPQEAGPEMKYMIMTFGDQSGLEGKSPEWLKEMITFMQRIDVELEASGELVFQQGLADPSQAKTVRVQDGDPGATDGPILPSGNSLAGF